MATEFDWGYEKVAERKYRIAKKSPDAWRAKNFTLIEGRAVGLFPSMICEVDFNGIGIDDETIKKYLERIVRPPERS